MNFRVMCLQKPAHGGIIQQLSNVTPDQCQVQHVFPVAGLDGLEIAFQHFHFLFHPGHILRRHPLGFLGLFRVVELVLGVPKIRAST